jgi:hypothetical protein
MWQRGIKAIGASMTPIQSVIGLFKRNPWLVAVLMLALASLACDDAYPALPFVEAVQADAQVPGRAYAQVRNVREGATGTRTLTTQVYETSDYGRTWQRSDAPIRDPRPEVFAFRLVREALRDANGREVWTFPRATFRSFFYHDSSGYRYQLPAGAVSNSAGDRTLYVAMGTEGVLVGRFDAEEVLKLSAWSRITWSLESRGIDVLNPLTLTITNPLQIAGVVLLGILIPPLVLIHTFVLRRVWRYATSERNAGYWALLTSLCTAVFAGLAIVIWLLDIKTDYYPMVAVMTVITVAISVGGSGLLTRGCEADVRRRLISVTALVSLLVPAGVAAVWALWPFIVGLVWGYWVYDRVYVAFYGPYLTAVGHPRPRWLIDRLTLETVGAVTVGLFSAGAAIMLSNGLLRLRGDAQVLLWVAIITIFVVAAVKIIVDCHASAVIQWVVRDVGEQAAVQAPFPTTGLNEHVRPVLTWFVGTVMFAGLVFIGQAWAYGWFGWLLR